MFGSKRGFFYVAHILTVLFFDIKINSIYQKYKPIYIVELFFLHIIIILQLYYICQVYF
ncbi:hypothetical protein BDA99DRAFT_523972 [Phascolomyces articulosus]|uniref:Uncharacterized protein n=1 Tax=Phascolomyces articulosus TaxID=60185 RepID=A0AAD5P9A6_9FUNG|nr:hypothetical protein BDA99DRAFT_523972 [Phascolomyces articulosus]